MTNLECETLLKEHLILLVSEPWDFVTDDGQARFEVTVEGVGSYGSSTEPERLLLRLAGAVTWHRQHITHLVAAGRHGYGIVDELLAGRSVDCNLIAISSDRATSRSPFDVSDWRGGLGAIGALVLKKHYREMP